MRQLSRILLVLAVVALVIAAIIYLPRPRRDLSGLRTLGGQYDVRILRDTWGVPHVFGTTDADAAFGLAYAHAEDDFLTIQQIGLAARGRLATVYGPDAAPNDYMVQLLRIWEVTEARYESDLTPETRALLQGYADGLNYYAALHPDEVLPGLFPVSGIDLAAASVHRSPLFFGLDGVLGDLFGEMRPEAVSPRPSAAADGRRFVWGGSWGEGGLYGSNVFAAGPALTAEGSTFLAVNSHQPWEGPVAWYEAHVHSEAGWDMTGALFPGAPVIIHGHNRDLGWGFTVNHPDLIDVYVLDINPENENQYRFDGEWRGLEVRGAPLRVKLIGNLVWPVRQEFLWSVYGPVVRRPHGTYAIRYAGMGRVDIFQQLYRMNKATTFDEWRGALAGGGLPMFNVGYADRAGNVYYAYNGLLPVRQPGWDWSRFLPGDTSANLWTETLPFDRLPQVLNPPSGFIFNANSTPFQTTRGAGNPNPAAYGPEFGIETAMTNRALRGLELFGAADDLTFDDFEAIKWDMAYSTESDVARYRDALLAAPVGDEPAYQEGLAVLRDWDLVTAPDSAGASLMVLTLNDLLASGAGIEPSQLVGRDLPEATLVASYRRAVDALVRHFGRATVPWERVNRLVRGDVNIGLGGGPDIIRAVYGQLQDDGTLRGFVGDGVVTLVAWDAAGNVSGRTIHQYGSATDDPTSPHYADQAPLFARGEMRPEWFDEADIRANLEREYRPGEE